MEPLCSRAVPRPWKGSTWRWESSWGPPYYMIYPTASFRPTLTQIQLYTWLGKCWKIFERWSINGLFEGFLFSEAFVRTGWAKQPWQTIELCMSPTTPYNIKRELFPKLKWMNIKTVWPNSLPSDLVMCLPDHTDPKWYAFKSTTQAQTGGATFRKCRCHHQHWPYVPFSLEKTLCEFSDSMRISPTCISSYRGYALSTKPLGVAVT